MLTGRVFLDTSIVNLIIDHREVIFDGYSVTEGITNRLQEDVYAMYHILALGQRSGLNVVISPMTFEEIMATMDKGKRNELAAYCSELRAYFHEFIPEVSIPATEAHLIKEFLETKCFSLLQGENDKKLVIEALYYKCDYFCTRDWNTILKHRGKLKDIPIKFIRPCEWLEMPMMAN